MTGAQWGDLLKTLGLPVALLIVALVTGAKDRPQWVFGREHREAIDRIAALEAENAELRKLAARGMTAAEKVATKRPPRTTGEA